MKKIQSGTEDFLQVGEKFDDDQELFLALVEPPDGCAYIFLSRKQVKKLRKALKLALNEGSQ